MNSLLHFNGANGTNATYTKGFYLCELAWVQNEAMFLGCFIEFSKFVVGIGRCMEGHNNGCLDRRIEVRLEALFGHAI